MSSLLNLPTWISPTMKQTWVMIPVLLHKVGMGMSLGYTTCLITALKDPASTITMDMKTASWYASSLLMSSLFGYIIATYLMFKYGRKLSYIINCIPAILGMFFTVFGSDVTTLIIGRVLTGFTVGNNALMNAVIIGEYCSPDLRGMFFNMKTGMLNLGILSVHIIGYYTTWRLLAIIVTMPFVLSLIIACTWPESPSWLAEKKLYEKSEQAFYWLRGKTADSTREIEELLKSQHNRKTDKSFAELVIGFFKKFTQKNFLKPSFIILLSGILLETSGRHIFPSYAKQLISEVTSNSFDLFYYNIVIDILISLSGFLASYLITIMKMRTLLFSTGFITLIMIIISTTSLYLIKNGILSSSYYPITLVFFAIYFVFTNLGCTCVPLALVGELFPLEHKGVGSAIAGYIISIFMIVALKLMPIMVEELEIYGAFGVLAVCMAVVLAVLYFVLPETKNRTLQEIEDYFNYGKFREGGLVPSVDCENDFVVKNNN